MSVILKAPAAQVRTAHKSDPRVVETVAAVLEDIRTSGDSAVRKYSEKFDGWAPESFRLSDDQVAKIVSDLPSTVIDDLTFVQKQVRNFRSGAAGFDARRPRSRPLPGVRLGHRHIPVSASGAYVPGGRYPLPPPQPT